jgi:LPS-assembly protein
MRRRVAIAALLYLLRSAAAAAQGAAAFVVAGPPGQDITIEADHLIYDWGTRALRLEGHVVARRGSATLRAARGALDREKNLLTLQGGVIGVDGREVFLADAVVADLTSRSAELTHAVLYLKEKPPPANNPTAGLNSLTLRGARVRKLANGDTEAQNITLTPCDCGPNEPDYLIAASSAVIHGDRARLSGAELHLGGLPIPLFPLSMPLTGRQSGVLAPVFNQTPVTGFGFALPVFFTLGRSFDLTLTPGIFIAPTQSASSAVGSRSVWGPRLGLELRYAPAEGTRGSISFDTVYDLDRGTPPIRRGFGGLRGIAHLAHRTDGSGGTFAVQGAVASDVMIFQDTEPYALDRPQDFVRTDAGYWKALGPLTLGADALYMQDVRIPLSSYPQPDRRLFGDQPAGVADRVQRTTFQRVPGVFAQLAPVAVGPFSLRAEAGAVEFTPFVARGAEERITGFGPTDQQNAPPPVLPPGPDYGRAPALRFDASPRLVAVAPNNVPIDLRLELGARADAWVVQGVPGRSRQRVYGLADARASLDLDRRFGSVLHVVTPAVRVRAISRELAAGGPPIGDPTDAGGPVYSASATAAQQGVGPGFSRGPTAPVTQGVPGARRPYDEIDGAAPVTGEVEATLGLTQTLWAARPPGAPARVLRLDLLQDVLLWADGARSRFGEATAIASLQLGPLGISGEARYDWTSHVFSVLGANLGVHNVRGDEVHGNFLLLRGSSSERLRAGIDELFAAAQLAVATGPLTGTTNAGVSAALPFLNRGLRAAFDLDHLIIPDPIPTGTTDWNPRGTLVYETPCKCAAFRFTIGFPFGPGQRPRVVWGFFLDLKSLGSFGTS